MFANSRQPNTVWINNGTGTFTDSGQALGNSFSNSVAIGDLAGDGNLDAMIANNSENNLIWINRVRGACCVQGACSQIEIAPCMAVGGTYIGGNCSDAVCEQPPATGACCVTSGCSVNTESTCTELGGTWTEGDSCDNCTTTCPADLNHDGVVDAQDLTLLLAAWGVPCEP